MTASLATGGTQISDPAGCLVPCTRNSASATIVSPLVGSFTYRVTFNGQTVANLTVTVDLGTVVAKGTYKPSPSS